MAKLEEQQQHLPSYTSFKLNLSSIQELDGDVAVTEGYQRALQSGSHMDHIISHYMMGIVAMIICAFGIIANILSIIVLTRRSMRTNTTNLYLVALAIFDLLVLVFTILTNLKDTRLGTENELQGVIWRDVPFVPLSYPYNHALCITFQVTSVWLTVAFTTDRYIMICHPFFAEQHCTKKLAKIAIFLVFLLSLVYSIPRFFEHKIVRIPIKMGNSMNGSEDAISSMFMFETNFTYDIENMPEMKDLRMLESLPKVLLWYDITAYGHSPGFMRSYHIASWVILVVWLPLGTIAVMNTFLILEVSRSAKRGREINATERRRHDTNVMLIGVIIIFFICQVPAGISHIIWGVMRNKEFHFPTFILNEVGNLLVVLNSAVNIFPYYAFGKKFRKEFLRVFCRRGVSGSYMQEFSMERYPPPPRASTFNSNLNHEQKPSEAAQPLMIPMLTIQENGVPVDT